MNRTQNIKGFTIIEVVLVLAIAGLIFLMVFIALPALQSGQRDTARKNDVSSVASAVNSYGSNNRGAFPDTAQLETQIGYTGTGADKLYTGVSSNTTALSVVVSSPVPATLDVTLTDGQVRVYKSLKCTSTAPNGAVSLERGTSRQYATVTILEGSSKTGYCLDS